MAHSVLMAVSMCSACFAGCEMRPDLEVFVSSGLLDECTGAVAAFEARGVEGLTDTHYGALNMSLAILKDAWTHPACEQKIRSVGRELGFCLENSLDFCEELGMSSGGNATHICTSLLSFCCASLLHLSHSIIVLSSSLTSLLVDTIGCAVFGRDEACVDFAFTQAHVDTLCVQCPLQSVSAAPVSRLLHARS